MALYNYSSGAVALTTGFTNGVGTIWLDNVQCRGTETRLDACPANSIGVHNCGHIEDAGIRCRTLTSEKIMYIIQDFKMFKEIVETCINSYIFYFKIIF